MAALRIWWHKGFRRMGEAVATQPLRPCFSWKMTALESLMRGRWGNESAEKWEIEWSRVDSMVLWTLKVDLIFSNQKKKREKTDVRVLRKCRIFIRWKLRASNNGICNAPDPCSDHSSFPNMASLNTSSEPIRIFVQDFDIVQSMLCLSIFIYWEFTELDRQTVFFDLDCKWSSRFAHI